ncbi:MAG: dihydroxyacetone kinase subunit DhaL [Oscillospiraceae bacterium]
MESINIEQLKNALICASDLIIESEPYLTQVDTIIGDGDHGIGMKTGFTALKSLLKRTEFSDLFELFRSSGIELLRVMGGASGVIFGTMFIGGHETVRDKKSLNADELINFFEQGAASIMKRGRSCIGDKTMLDALIPAIDAMKAKNRETNDITAVLQSAYNGALGGVKNSEQLLPKIGRAKNFREKGIGYPDPGAVSVSIIFKGIYMYIKSIEN